MNYWYIWYEVIEDGESIGKSRYATAYSYKQNAVRRAKQMFSKDMFNPLTGTTITRKWFISQTNPWE